MRHLDSCLVKQPIQVLIGLVICFVAPAIADVVVDITEVLTDDEKFRAPVAEPLFPMTDHIGIELKFSATSDLAWALLDANPTGFPSRDQRVKGIHALSPRQPAPRSAGRACEADGRLSLADRDDVACYRSIRDTSRGGLRHIGSSWRPRPSRLGPHSPGNHAGP